MDRICRPEKGVWHVNTDLFVEATSGMRYQAQRKFINDSLEPLVRDLPNVSSVTFDGYVDYGGTSAGRFFMVLNLKQVLEDDKQRGALVALTTALTGCLSGAVSLVRPPQVQFWLENERADDEERLSSRPYAWYRAVTILAILSATQASHVATGIESLLAFAQRRGADLDNRAGRLTLRYDPALGTWTPA